MNDFDRCNRTEVIVSKFWDSDNEPHILKQKLLTIEARHSISKEEAKKRRLRASSSLFIPNRKNEVVTTLSDSMDHSLRSLKLNPKRKAQIEECRRLENLLRPLSEDCVLEKPMEQLPPTTNDNSANIAANFYKPLEYTLWNVESLLKPSTPPTPTPKDSEKELNLPSETLSSSNFNLLSKSPASESHLRSPQNYQNWPLISSAELKHSPEPSRHPKQLSPTNYFSSLQQENNVSSTLSENVLSSPLNSPKRYQQTPSPRELVIAEDPEPEDQYNKEDEKPKIEPTCVIDLTKEDSFASQPVIVAPMATPTVQITAELSADGSVVNLHIAELPIGPTTNDHGQQMTSEVKSEDTANSVSYGRNQNQSLQKTPMTSVIENALDLQQKTQIPLQQQVTSIREHAIENKKIPVSNQVMLTRKIMNPVNGSRNQSYFQPSVAPPYRPEPIRHTPLKQPRINESCPMCKLASDNIGRPTDSSQLNNHKKRRQSKIKSSATSEPSDCQQTAATNSHTSQMFHPYFRRATTFAPFSQMPVAITPQIPPAEYWYNMGRSLGYPSPISNKHFYPPLYTTPLLPQNAPQYQINPYYSIDQPNPWYPSSTQQHYQKQVLENHKSLRKEEADRTQHENAKYEWENKSERVSELYYGTGHQTNWAYSQDRNSTNEVKKGQK